mmetsp:Transcript_684/g.1963  ORF Transcript_684/g.1963 Transcript_684/m.1963 type:complete len:350 (+) Transcript_684:322-1371(+)
MSSERRPAPPFRPKPMVSIRVVLVIRASSAENLAPAVQELAETFAAAPGLFGHGAEGRLRGEASGLPHSRLGAARRARPRRTEPLRRPAALRARRRRRRRGRGDLHHLRALRLRLEEVDRAAVRARDDGAADALLAEPLGGLEGCGVARAGAGAVPAHEPQALPTRRRHAAEARAGAQHCARERDDNGAVFRLRRGMHERLQVRSVRQRPVAERLGEPRHGGQLPPVGRRGGAERPEERLEPVWSFPDPVPAQLDLKASLQQTVVQRVERQLPLPGVQRHHGAASGHSHQHPGDVDQHLLALPVQVADAGELRHHVAGGVAAVVEVGQAVHHGRAWAGARRRRESARNG